MFEIRGALGWGRHHNPLYLVVGVAHPWRRARNYHFADFAVAERQSISINVGDRMHTRREEDSPVERLIDLIDRSGTQEEQGNKRTQALLGT